MNKDYNEECILNFERELKKVKNFIMKGISETDTVSVETQKTDFHLEMVE